MNQRSKARRHRGRNRMRPPRSGPVRAHQVGNPATDPIAAIAYWKDRLGDPLFVYFIQSGENGPVKIGKGTHPVSRMAHHQCGNPELLHLRAVVLASLDLEETLHVYWRNVCVRGEWFGGGYQEQIIGMALEAMAAQIGQPQNDLYEASSALVKGMVHPRRLS